MILRDLAEKTDQLLAEMTMARADMAVLLAVARRAELSAAALLSELRAINAEPCA